MSGKKSKAKGSSWEREVAKFLSDTYGESFTRTAHSGAFIGRSNAHRRDSLATSQVKSYKGDVFPPDTWDHFNCECKSFADFPFHLVITGDCKVLDGWITQTYETANDGDFNIIFMKITRKGKWVAVESSTGIRPLCSIEYHGWVFASWDNFWTPETINRVKELST